MTEPWFQRLESWLQPRIRIRSKLGRACLAEFIGIFILVVRQLSIHSVCLKEYSEIL